MSKEGLDVALSDKVGVGHSSAFRAFPCWGSVIPQWDNPQVCTFPHIPAGPFPGKGWEAEQGIPSFQRIRAVSYTHLTLPTSDLV